MLTKIIEQIHLVSGHRPGQHSAHFARKNAVPQLLGLADFVQVPCPSHCNALAGSLGTVASQTVCTGRGQFATER